MASTARAKQCAVLKMHQFTARDHARKMAHATRAMNCASDAINVVPTKTLPSRLRDQYIIYEACHDAKNPGDTEDT